ncbi:MAG: hypothetical protein DME89_11060 [Verrucomicrobia bacterium]|nr:MAG: hypothetical protein DME89_11060 [Verrucomicrobiota bacterium]
MHHLRESFRFCAQCAKQNGRRAGCQTWSSVPPALPSAIAFSSRRTNTSIGVAGDEFVASFTADSYRKFMQAWEAELNHFLKTGSRLGNDNAP